MCVCVCDSVEWSGLEWSEVEELFVHGERETEKLGETLFWGGGFRESKREREREMSRWSRGCGTGIGLSGHTNQYRHGVTIENWVEDTHAISALKNNSTLLGARQSRDAVTRDESLTSTYMRSFTSEVCVSFHTRTHISPILRNILSRFSYNVHIIILRS